MAKIIPIINAKVSEKGLLEIVDQKKWSAWLRTLVGKNVWIKVEPAKKPRTLNQNAYYHGVALPLIAEATRQAYGGDALNEDICQLIRKKYAENKKVFFHIGAEPHLKIKSTADMKSDEMGEFLTWFASFAKDFFNIVLPDPEEFKNNPQFWVEGE